MEYEPRKLFLNLIKNKDFQLQLADNIENDYVNIKKELEEKNKQYKNELFDRKNSKEKKTEIKENIKEKENKLIPNYNKTDKKIIPAEEINFNNTSSKSLNINGSIYEKEEFQK